MNKRSLLRPFALLMAMLFVTLCFCPALAVSADEKSFRLTEGSIVIGADGDALYVQVGEKRTTLSADTTIVIDGAHTASPNTITVKDNVKANIKLSGVRIEATGFLKAPIELVGAENVTLTLSGSNRLTAKDYMAALQVNQYASLTIRGDGSLTATGGKSAAGIGGGWKSGVAGAPCGDITIGGKVNIVAIGGENAAAIGGGEGGASGQIIVTDSAIVSAKGGKNAAGIGSGSSARSRTITISSAATVEASGGDGAAGIGSGKGGNASKIEIRDTAVVRTMGGLGGAGIGSGSNASATMVAIGDNAIVRARGGDGAAAIGAGKASALTVGVNISGFANVFAIGGKDAAGIGGTTLGGGNLTLTGSALVETYGGIGGAGFGGGKGGNVLSITIDSRATIYAYGGKNAAGIGTGESGSYEKIKIAGFSNVYALGGKYGAGIGGGKTSACGQIRIHDSSFVTAQGGNFGAGIGTGAKNAPDFAPSAGDIYIYGDASVRAAGGKDAAGIGGGLFASGGRVTVTDTAAVSSYDNLTVTVDSNKPEKLADYSKVEAAIAKVPKNLEEFTEQSVKILQDAIKEINYNLPATKQEQVDNYAASIERAISILVKKGTKVEIIPADKSFESGKPLIFDYKGATSPKDQIVILKKGHLPTDTEIDPVFQIPYGKPIFSQFCADTEGKLVSEGTVVFVPDKNHFLSALGYGGLPEGEYTAYFCAEGKNEPIFLVNFKVTGTALNEADYSAVEEAIASIPQDLTPYSTDSVTALQNAINAIEYNLLASDQAKVDGFAKAIRDAIAALTAVNSVSEDVVQGTSFYTLPDGTKESYSLSLLTHTVGQNERVVLLAKASEAPESYGWGLIPTHSSNIEEVGKESIVPAINHVTNADDVQVGENENFDTTGLASSKIGAGAGCNMQGSFKISDTATFNGSLATSTVHLEYRASIGRLSFDYISGETFALPANVTCPGYIFKGWSTDENGTSPASGTFTLGADLTFYANWDIVPVSIEKDFRFASGALGVNYSDQIRLSEASANFTATISSGELPKGLTLDPTTGRIFGVPTDLGTFDFTLLIVDANGTRTEEAYSISIYQPVEMTFTFHTSKVDEAATKGEIYFYYSYRDRGNGALKESTPINLTELLSEIDPNALKPANVDTITLTLGAYVGEPVELFFENSMPEDGWRVDKVVISSPGGDGMHAFEKTYQVNAWIGNVDKANFFESGAFGIFVILLVILLAIVGLIIFLRIKNRKQTSPTPSGRGAVRKSVAKKPVKQIKPNETPKQ